jgi:hypothetical protein
LLVGVVCCFALAFLKQRRKTEAILGSGKGGNHDVEKGDGFSPSSCFSHSACLWATVEWSSVVTMITDGSLV